MRAAVGFITLLFASVLHGCGGGAESDGAASLRAQADSAEARALALAPTAVCTNDIECSFISLEDAFPSCTQHRDFPILAAAPTRIQAEAAAASQKAIAREARSAPGVQWDFVCASYVEPDPTPYCEQMHCRLKATQLEIIALPGA